jgi:hypothetical protein
MYIVVKTLVLMYKHPMSVLPEKEGCLSLFCSLYGDIASLIK